MKRCLLPLLLLLSTLPSPAQIYKYIGVNEGLSDRHVYAICKGKEGYMWFLTHNGIDRYNGKEFKPYKLMDGGKEVNSMTNLNWLYVDAEGGLWEIGKKGRVFRYDVRHDRFELVYKLPDEATKGEQTPLSYAYVDADRRIWLCSGRYIYLYHVESGEVTLLENTLKETITRIARANEEEFFIGTDKGVRYARLQRGAQGETLTFAARRQLDSTLVQTSELYYHPGLRKLFIGTFLKGLFVYDMDKEQLLAIDSGLTDVNITRFFPCGKDTLLVATDGAGVYKMDLSTCLASPYIVADFTRQNAMNGNNIYDIYADESDRIWMANYPVGITVRDNRYSDYRWVKHATGNARSLVNDQVNDVIEDAEGDLWYATGNGISLYRRKAGKWQSFLSTFDSGKNHLDHTFISLCEVSPGVVWAGGYSSGIYEIEKRTGRVSYFTPSRFHARDIRPDKYIRTIFKDREGLVWSGGYYNLKRFDTARGQVELIPGLDEITVIADKDDHRLWIGTASGLYLLDKREGTYRNIPLPVESYYIYSLYQASDGLLYIGTNSSGLLVFNPADGSFKHYHKKNSALLSDNIYAILSDGGGTLFLSTEYAICSFNTATGTIHNWTKEQGLKADHFNPDAGTLTRDGILVFGSTDGAIAFDKQMKLPRDYPSKLVFSDLRLFYEKVYPDEKGSPLETDIDHTRTLKLKYKQNIFSLQVSSINYDYPSLILYSWKLEGFYDGWSRPGRENTIRFTNLSPGRYTLRVRAVSNEDRRIVLEERDMQILIERSFWLGAWAMLLYAAALTGIIVTAHRLFILRRQRKEADEKIRFFVNTAHDIRTPLTLIKAPLEEVMAHEPIGAAAQEQLCTSLRNVDSLLHLTNNLLNFERAGMDTARLQVEPCELSGYLEAIVESFQAFARTRGIQLAYTHNFATLQVPIDKEKMDSILKNILSNALKYTPQGGYIHITATQAEHHWSVKVDDTGIGLSPAEQKRLFKAAFRGSNALDARIGGSGIGLLMVQKLVQLHKGKIQFSSAQGQGSSVKVTFPKAYKHYLQEAKPTADTTAGTPLSTVEGTAFPVEGTVPAVESTASAVESTASTIGHTASPTDKREKILIAEDDAELRGYLAQTLAKRYHVKACGDGKEALTAVGEYLPDLVISDIMMPGMRGDALCKAIKTDMATSHIPVILLTALGGERHIIEGLHTGADKYIVKPFNIDILQAGIAGLLANRALLRQKYGNPAGLYPDWADEADNSTDLNRRFLAQVKRHVEENITRPDFNVDTLCQKLNMSRTSFYNKIKALTGEAPADYIRLLRLIQATRLLKEQRYNITEIAEMTGFNDAKYFREVFKKHFGVSPSQYIKQDNKNHATGTK
ncbi:MAG: ATP-binding protein [Prevotellaceae bacterium]|nr:ATP-binding protein [Prevotellaceae bacterium]